MSCQITWLGHGGWQIVAGEHTVLLDPFLTDCPTAATSVDEINASHILVSHGHFDHIADVPAIANRTGATVIAIFEIAQWLATNHDVQKTVGMNIGGGVDVPFGRIKMTPALHSSQLPDGSYGGEPAGFVIEIANKRLYFACDTALFSDMQLIGKSGIDFAAVPIGDLFTMGPADSLEAIKLVKPTQVAPAHYGTWPPIEQDAAAWAERVKAETSAKPLVVKPGETIQLT